MTIKNLISALASLAALAAPLPAIAQSLADGAAAYDAGDYTQAHKIFHDLATAGSAAAQFNMGNLFLNGWGVTQNDGEAVRWYRLSSEQGYPAAQFLLGSLYSNGQGVAQDHTTAVQWYRLAARQGHAGAQFILGLHYYHGQGVELDHAEAVRWITLAAEQGSPEAQQALEALEVR